MSNALTLARPYARAAFALARDAGRLGDWSSRLAFSAHVASDPRVHALLGHPGMRADDLVALLLPEADVEGAYRDFLAVLAQNHRLSLLADIAGQFEALRADEERVVRARVTSAQALDSAEFEKIKAALARRFGREVQVHASVDPELIGGALIEADDLVIDGSLRGKLSRLQTALSH